MSTLLTRTNPLFSIIIPFYNASDTIAATLLSILDDAATASLEQLTCPWLQILCIDNASTDSSQSALDAAWESFPSKSFATLEKFFEPKRGVSYARNQGLEHSIGEYVAFIDADDSIKPGYFRLLLEGANAEADVVSLCCISDKNRLHLAANCELMTVGAFVNQFLIGWWCCSFIARRNLYKGLLFYGQCYEDLGLFPFLLSKARMVLVTCHSYYDYKETPGSLTSESPSWRCKQWDQQEARLRKNYSSLLPIIRKRIDRELLDQRMLLRAAAGDVPVLNLVETIAFIRMVAVDDCFLAGIVTVIRKNLVAALRLARRKLLYWLF